ncbi:MAG: hypothetical protein ACI4JC_07970 [Faecalibacterium sp.]
MASSKKRARRGRAAALVILCILLVCAVALGTLYFMLSQKVTALQQGASFQFSYSITPTADESPTLYQVLAQSDALQGHVSGLYASGRIQLELFTQDSSAEPLTRLYIDPSETLYDVRQLYSTVRNILTDQYPLASLLLPDWSLGDYISQQQLALALGIDAASVELQDTTGFRIDLRSLKIVKPAEGKEGYLYLSLPNSTENGPALLLGLPTDRIFEDIIPLHVLLDLPAQGLHIELAGSLSLSESVVLPPESRMKDEDIAAFAQIRQAVTNIIAILQNAASQLPAAQS